MGADEKALMEVIGIFHLGSWKNILLILKDKRCNQALAYWNDAEPLWAVRDGTFPTFIRHTFLIRSSSALQNVPNEELPLVARL
jgi:hypothetical protein